MVVVHDALRQVVVRSYPLGGGGKAEFSCAAVLDPARDACSAAVHDTATQQHRLVTWPAHLPGSKEQLSAAGTPPCIADNLQSINLPSRPHSLHALEAPATGGHSSLSSIAVVLADGQVGLSIPDMPQLSMMSPPATSIPRLRAACSTGNMLCMLHQASAGEAASLHVYILADSPSGPQLYRTQDYLVPCPTQNATAKTVHAASTFSLVTWSTGALTVVKGPASATHLVLPPGLAPVLSTAANTSITTTPGKKSSSKRKAGTEEPTTAIDESAAALVVAAAVDSTQLLVAHLRIAQAATPAHLQFALLDHQFGCVLSSGTVPLDGASAGSLTAASLAAVPHATALPILQLLSPTGTGNGRLLLLALGSVFTLSISAPQANLLALVGRLSVGDRQPAAPVGQQPAMAPLTLATTLDAAALHTLVAGAVGSAVGKSLGGEDELVLRPLPGQPQAAAGASSAHPVAKIMAALHAARAADRPASAQVLQGAVDAMVVAMQPQASPAASANGAAAPAMSASVALTVLAPLAVGCLATAGEWQQLGRVLGVLPPRALSGCPVLLPALSQAQQYDLLPQACNRLDEVAPEDLVTALQALLAPTTDSNRQARRHNRAHLRTVAEGVIGEAQQQLTQLCPPPASGLHASALDGDEVVERRRAQLARAACAAATVDGFTSAQVLLHAPLAMQMDPAGLAGALRQLNNAQVDRLLSYLAKWVAKYVDSLSCVATSIQSSVRELQLPDDLVFPSYPQVLDWVRLIIDSHLPRLLVTKFPLASLLQLVSLSQRQVGLCQQLLPLVGAAEHVRSQAPLPAAHVAAAAQYTVQYIDLGIA